MSLVFDLKVGDDVFVDVLLESPNVRCEVPNRIFGCVD